MKDNVCAPGLVILLPAIFLVSTATAQAGWWRTYGGAAIDPDHFVQQTADGGYILAGYTASFGDKFDDAYLVKTDSLGNVGVAEESPGQQTSGRKPAATVD